jgi:hypothetical protein
MKLIVRLIFFSAFGLSAITLSAQTITQSFNEPSIGEVDINYKLDTSSYTAGLPIHQSGSSVLWDFTNLFGAFPIIYDSIHAPNALPSSSLYPGASYCYEQDIAQSYFKSNTVTAQTELMGIYSSTLALTFTNTALVATYPISYGYNSVDQVSGRYALGTNTGACNGSITVSAPATGTINFPYGVSFTNVLLLRSVQQLTMSSGLFPLGTIRQNIYSFYAPQLKYPVFTVRYQVYQLLAGTPTITALAYGSNNYFSVAGLSSHQNLDALRVLYPNPFTDVVSIVNENSSKVVDQELIVYSLDGKEVARCKGVTEISLVHLPRGYYLAELRSKNSVQRQKIIKE